MEESEIKELILSLKEAHKNEDWSLVSESIDYLNDIYDSFVSSHEEL